MSKNKQQQKRSLVAKCGFDSRLCYRSQHEMKTKHYANNDDKTLRPKKYERGKRKWEK
jgi:hypothetical protein